MKQKLPKAVYQSLQETIRRGSKLDHSIANEVAHAVKEWALAKGASHFCHWFQPQTGLTAEKHDAFLTFDDEGQPVLGPGSAGCRGALAALLAGVAVASAQGTWERLKACSAESCQWAFYDRSKNRSGRWCSMQTCGNRTKTRTYRSRRRAGS